MWTRGCIGIVMRPPARAAGGVRETGLMAGSSLRILLVEDDAPLRTVLAEVLREDGYAVEEAADGRSALDAMRAVPDAVVLDLQLPYLDGASFIRELRDRPAQGRVPLLVVSGAVQAADAADRLGRTPLCASRSLAREPHGRVSVSGGAVRNATPRYSALGQQAHPWQVAEARAGGLEARSTPPAPRACHPSGQTWRTFLANDATMCGHRTRRLCRHSRSRRATSWCSSPTADASWCTPT
jgi:CheY-like chemotaxis protein